MAEETKKSTTTTKKRTTTSKPKVEEPKPLSIEEQMAQMMAMMAQQQQIIMAMLQGQVAQSQTIEVQEEPQQEETVKKDLVEEKPQEKTPKTKQDLRRKYKDKEIYVMNVTQGVVSYQGRNMRYSWDSYGDIEPMSIDDVVNMPKSFLSTPCLLIDSYENGKNVKQEIERVLHIKDVDGYIDLLTRIETQGFKTHDEQEDIIEQITQVVKKSKQRGCDLTLDLAILVQHKIDKKELTDYHLIGELSKLLGRKFL